MIAREEEKTDPNVVKVVGSPLTLAEEDAGILRALYFTRATAPSGPGPLYHHIGLYAYRRAALDRYVTLPPSPLEAARAAGAAPRAGSTACASTSPSSTPCRSASTRPPTSSAPASCSTP